MRPRHAGPADVAAIEALHAKAFTAGFATAYDEELLRAALPLLARLDRRLLQEGRYLLLEEAGRLLAGGGWSLYEPGSGRDLEGQAHLRAFAVRPEAAGRGLGRRIAEACEAEARAVGARELLVLASLNAVPFYAALGFAPLEPRAIPLGPDLRFPALLMRKTALG